MLVLGLLLTIHGLVDASSISDYPKACISELMADRPMDTQQCAYSCDLTSANAATILMEIKQPCIVFLYILINKDVQNFIFENSSFPPNLEHLTIETYFPFHLTSGALRGIKDLRGLKMKNWFDLNKFFEDLNQNETETVYTVPDTFGNGWLAPVTGLKYLKMEYSSIYSFPSMQFCILSHLQTLDLTHNQVDLIGKFGITCNSSDLSCTPCLPNVTYLNLSQNPIKHLQVNMSKDLPILETLNMSSCRLSYLDLNMVLTRNLEILDLTNNTLHTLDLMGDNTCDQSHLTVVLLQDNQLQNVSEGLLSCFSRIKYLNLGNNSLSHIALANAGLSDLTQLRWLDLSYNNIITLQSSSIGKMTKLIEFSCSGCSLRSIEGDTFQLLEKLQILKLDHNNLHHLSDSIFLHLKRLSTLNLAHNQFLKIPNLLSTSLSILYLDHNNITAIRRGDFNKSTRLKTMSLAFNHIKLVPNETFSKLEFLETLNIDNNDIKTIEYFGFDPLFHLKSLTLNNNALLKIPPLKLDIKRVRHLDLSRNMIQAIRLEKSADLEWIDMSYNAISKLRNGLVDFPKLKFMDLRHNKLSMLSEEAFMTNTLPRPQVWLEGNPFHCDCYMEWLLFSNSGMRNREERFKDQTKNDVPFRNFEQIDKKGSSMPEDQEQFVAEISDLDLTSCATTPTGGNTSLSSMAAANFVCPYQTECNDWRCWRDCCAEEENCPCRSFCYPKCSCYHKHDQSVNFMNCSSRGMSSLPSQGLIYVKKVTLDGNNVTLINASLINFPNVQSLLINNNNIYSLEPGTFDDLKKMQFLDLHQNNIRLIRSATFRHLAFLEELYLQDNYIRFIENDTFEHLLRLNTLWLHGNRLEYLNLSLFDVTESLTELTLHDNPWLCDCQFGPVFQKWLRRHSNIVLNITHIYCMNYPIARVAMLRYRNITENDMEGTINESLHYHPILSADFSFCNSRGILTTFEDRHTKPLIETISLGATFIVLVFTILVVYRCRFLIKVWIYDKYGIRFKRNADDDEEKTYDVFIVYAEGDEEFVLHEMLPELEEGKISYKVCERSRDWPMLATTSGMVLASVQQSKRSILLISENYFNSQWSEFAFDAAHYRALNESQMRLIIAVTDKELLRRMTRTMKLYVMTSGFLSIGEKWFWKKLRYYLADNPRGADHVVGRQFHLLEV